jgi:hypothetical protein
MALESTIRILNRLLAIHSRSLAAYLRYAAPNWQRCDQHAREVLDQIALDQQSYVDRIGEMVLELDGAVSYGAFPIEFTGYHDLSFRFLLGKLIEHQRRDIRLIQRCVEELATAPLARALAEEALGAAKAHLELLQGAAQSAPCGV